MKLEDKYYGRNVAVGALTGSHVKGLAHKDSDFDLKVFVFPTTKDVLRYTKCQESLKGVCLDTGTPYEGEVKDFRDLPVLTEKMNPSALEVYASDEVTFAANQGVYNLWKMKDELVVMDLPRLYSATMGVAQKRMTEMFKETPSKKELFEKYGYNTKTTANALHLMGFLLKFAENGFTGFKEVFDVSHTPAVQEHLQMVRFGKYTKEEATELVTEVNRRAVELRELYHSQPVNEQTKERMWEYASLALREEMK